MFMCIKVNTHAIVSWGVFFHKKDSLVYIIDYA